MKRMLKKTLWAATMVLAVTGSYAQEATPDVWMKAAVSVLSRADVVADLMNARMSGVFDVISAGVFMFESRRGTVSVRLADGTPMASAMRTRREVSAGVLEARKSGELKKLNAEAFEFSYLAP